MTTFLPTLHYSPLPELDAEDKRGGFTSSVIVSSSTDFGTLTQPISASDTEESSFLSTGGADGQARDGRVSCAPHTDVPNAQEKKGAVDGSVPAKDALRKQTEEEDDGKKKSPRTRDRCADVGKAVSVDDAPASSSLVASTGRVLKQKTNLMKAEGDGKGSGAPGSAGSGGESNMGEYGGRPKRGTAAGRKSKGNKMSAVVGADGEVQIVMGGGNKKQQEGKEAGMAECDGGKKTSAVGDRKVSSRKESLDRSGRSIDGDSRRTEGKEREKGETKEEDEREKRRRLRAEKRTAVLLGQRKAIFEVQMVLLEGVATEGQMQVAKKILIRSEYEDVVAERANIRVCGNPRCGNALAPEFPGRRRGRYRISLREKKVYDTHAVLNYCSAECAVASKMYECSLEKEHGMELGLTELAKLVSAIKTMGSKPVGDPRGDGDAGNNQIATGQGASDAASELKTTSPVNGENEVNPSRDDDGNGDGASHRKPELHISERVSSAAQAEALSSSSTLVPTGPANAIEGYVLQNRAYPAAVIAGAAATQSKRRQGKIRKTNSSSGNDAVAAPEVRKTQRGGSSVRLALKSAEANDEHLEAKVLPWTGGPETDEATTVSPRSRRSLTNKEHLGEGSLLSERMVEAVVGQRESRRKSNRRGVMVSGSTTAAVCPDRAAEAHHVVDHLPAEPCERRRAASSVSSEGIAADSDSRKATGGELQAAEPGSIPTTAESVGKHEVEAVEQTGDDLRTLPKADEATGSGSSAAPSPPKLRSALHKEKHRVPRSVSWADHRNAPLEVVDPRDVREARVVGGCRGDAFISQWGARRPRGSQPKRYCKLEGKRRGGLRDVIIFDDALGSEMVDLGPSMSRLAQEFSAVSGKREQRNAVSGVKDEKGLVVGTDRGPPKGLPSSGARAATASNKRPVSESFSGHGDATSVKGEVAAGQGRSKRLLEVVAKGADDGRQSGGSLAGPELCSLLAEVPHGEGTATLGRGDGNDVDVVEEMGVPERTGLGFAETVKGSGAVCADGGVSNGDKREDAGRHVEDSAVRGGVKNELVGSVDGQNEASKDPDARSTASRTEMAENTEKCYDVQEDHPTKTLDLPVAEPTDRLNRGEEAAVMMSGSQTVDMCVPSTEGTEGKFCKAQPSSLEGQMGESTSAELSNGNTMRGEDATQATRCIKVEESTEVAPGQQPGEEIVTRSRDAVQTAGQIPDAGSSGSTEDTSETCGAGRASTEVERRRKGKEAVADGSGEVDDAATSLQGESRDDPRLSSAKAIAEALAQAAAAVESGDADSHEAAALAGISIMPPETSAGSEPSPLPCFSGRGELEEGLPDDQEEEGDVEDDEESLQWTTDSPYSAPSLRNGRRFDRWQKSEWYSPPPKGFQAQVSQFGTIWMSLEEWVSASTVVYLYREDVGTGNEAVLASDDLVVTGRHYPKQIVCSDGTSAEISRAFSECISRALPLVQQSLRISVPLTSIEQAMGRLIKSFSFVSPLPSLGMAQWRAVSILFVEALSIHRLPRVHEQLSRQRGLLKKAIEKTGTLESEYKAFWDLIMPWGDRKPKLNVMTA
ncbi:hypothetical protein CBR_g20185 [Chara braunii]|uniref:RNA polymerase II subunit B1 CTD phosphatase RPAP2 homolog n=1 Tax=Chara braunii TaxID=69332 RepID=A0A388KZR5_CHABU|nr:hypothetical protein CBR_g20185 [Chara braunii]|eukprot:GBG75554.1 hypothetical protein CBR_g20185 [Chara braunii]